MAQFPHSGLAEFLGTWHSVRHWEMFYGPWSITNTLNFQAHEISQRWASPLSWAHGQGWVSRVPHPACFGAPWATLLRPSLLPEVPSRATHWCLLSYEPKNFSFSPGLRGYLKIFSLLWQFQHREPLECQALASTVFPSLEAQHIPLWSTAFGKTKARRITVFWGE